MDKQQRLTAHRPELTYYHANAKGGGYAVAFELRPAREKSPGCVYASFANQKTVGDRRQGTFSTFDWKGKICVKLSINDLSQMLQVFRGLSESVAEGKGLFHRSATANATIKLEHRIDPAPGYLFEAWRRPIDGGDGLRARVFFNPTEALGLSLALEQSMGAIAFGVPAADAREEAEDEEPADCAGWDV